MGSDAITRSTQFTSFVPPSEITPATRTNAELRKSVGEVASNVLQNTDNEPAARPIGRSEYGKINKGPTEGNRTPQNALSTIKNSGNLIATKTGQIATKDASTSQSSSTDGPIQLLFKGIERNANDILEGLEKLKTNPKDRLEIAKKINTNLNECTEYLKMAPFRMNTINSIRTNFDKYLSLCSKYVNNCVDEKTWKTFKDEKLEILTCVHKAMGDLYNTAKTKLHTEGLLRPLGWRGILIREEIGKNSKKDFSTVLSEHQAECEEKLGNQVDKLLQNRSAKKPLKEADHKKIQNYLEYSLSKIKYDESRNDRKFTPPQFWQALESNIENEKKSLARLKDYVDERLKTLDPKLKENKETIKLLKEVQKEIEPNKPVSLNQFYDPISSVSQIEREFGDRIASHVANDEYNKGSPPKAPIVQSEYNAINDKSFAEQSADAGKAKASEYEDTEIGVENSNYAESPQGDESAVDQDLVANLQKAVEEQRAKTQYGEVQLGNPKEPVYGNIYQAISALDANTLQVLKEFANSNDKLPDKALIDKLKNAMVEQNYNKLPVFSEEDLKALKDMVANVGGLEAFNQALAGVLSIINK